MRYIDINIIMDRITRHPLLEDIPFETVIDYSIDFIRMAGIAPSFLEKDALIRIENFRGVLPCDFYQMIQVRLVGPGKRTFRYSTDSFHMSPGKPIKTDLTYKLQGDCIFTSIECGDIEIAYLALPVSDEGYPLIPDNSSFCRALELYIKYQWFTILFDTGKINANVYQNAEIQYLVAYKQASSEMIMPTIDQMESITNMWTKVLPDTTRDHRNGYVFEGAGERLINH